MRIVTGVLMGAAAVLALMPWSLSAAAQPGAGRENTDSRGPAASCTNDGPLLVERKYAWPRQKEIALDGTWQLAFGDASQPAMVLPDLGEMAWFETSVPTGVHGALHRAGKAPSPYVGLNAKALRWVEDKAWWFRKSFRVPKDFAGGRRTEGEARRDGRGLLCSEQRSAVRGRRRAAGPGREERAGCGESRRHPD